MINEAALKKLKVGDAIASVSLIPGLELEEDTWFDVAHVEREADVTVVGGTLSVFGIELADCVVTFTKDGATSDVVS